MAEETTPSNVWLSTYGLITVERVLGHYQIRLQPDDLIHTLNHGDTFFCRLVQVPLINVMTGLIRQQAYDFQIYAQKLFVDYLLSGETVKPDASPGGLTREELESIRLELVDKSKLFHQIEYEHDKQISICQREIVLLLKAWRKVFRQVTQGVFSMVKKQEMAWSMRETEAFLFKLLANMPLDQLDSEPQKVFASLNAADSETAFQQVGDEFCQLLSPLRQQSQQLLEKTAALQPAAKDIQNQVRQCRETFEKIIIDAKELLRGLPDYQVDPEQDEANRELIQLDKEVSEGKQTD